MMPTSDRTGDFVFRTFSAGLIARSIITLLLGTAAIIRAQGPPPPPLPIRVEIVGPNGARPGQEVTAGLRLSSGGDRVEGYSFLIAFDSTVMRFRRAVPGRPKGKTVWQDFECRPVPQSERESIYPLCLLQVSARRHPTDRVPFASAEPTVQAAELTFAIIDDPRIACRSLPLQFFWRRCDDNVIYEAPGSHPRYVRRVFDRFRPAGAPENVDFDTLPPAVGDLPLPCNGWTASVRNFTVDFIHGAVDVSCLDGTSGLRPPAGDFDHDGISGGPTDLAILAELILRDGVDNSSRKNIYGGVLSYAPDGTALTLGSLVRLANPVPAESLVNLPPHGDILLLSIPPRPDTARIYCQSTVPLGGILLVFDVDGLSSSPRPATVASGMITDFVSGDGFLRLIMFAHDGRLLPPGIHSLADIPCTGSLRLRTAAAVDRFGHPIKMIFLGD